MSWTRALKALTGGKSTAHISGGIPKNNAVLRSTIQSAIAAVVADGSCDQLLKKWGLEQGALRSAPVNAGTLF